MEGYLLGGEPGPASARPPVTPRPVCSITAAADARRLDRLVHLSTASLDAAPVRLVSGMYCLPWPAISGQCRHVQQRNGIAAAPKSASPSALRPLLQRADAKLPFRHDIRLAALQLFAYEMACRREGRRLLPLVIQWDRWRSLELGGPEMTNYASAVCRVPPPPVADRRRPVGGRSAAGRPAACSPRRERDAGRQLAGRGIRLDRLSRHLPAPHRHLRRARRGRAEGLRTGDRAPQHRRPADQEDLDRTPPRACWARRSSTASPIRRRSRMPRCRRSPASSARTRR